VFVGDTVARIFADVLNVDEADISDDSSPDTISTWDSVAAMTLVAALEDTFNIEFSTKEIMAMRTVGLVRTVLRRKGVADA
jgi:acyl carrier protein